MKKYLAVALLLAGEAVQASAQDDWTIVAPPSTPPAIAV